MFINWITNLSLSGAKGSCRGGGALPSNFGDIEPKFGGIKALKMRLEVEIVLEQNNFRRALNFTGLEQP